jgi:hypothetical protein
MSSDQTPRITVIYKDGGSAFTMTYAVNEDILGELDRKRDWRGRKLTGKKFQTWLESKGCKLDCPDGPAVIWHSPSCSETKEYWRDGKLQNVIRHEAGSLYTDEEIADGVDVKDALLRPTPKAPRPRGPQPR